MSELSSAKAALKGQPSELYPHAALAAVAWPGLGHIVLGQRKRGFLIMVGVLFLFFGGLFIGGIDVVDRQDAKLWFWAQSGNFPLAFATDFINQKVIKTKPPDAQMKFLSIGHVNEIGTLFVALAGLMNVVVILDALQPRFGPGHEPPDAPQLRRRKDDTADESAGDAA